MIKLKYFLINEQKHNIVFPKNKDIFNCFLLTPFSKIKVVILGQDPYHGENQAHGLSFSVNKGVSLPPSLINIFKELNDDLGFSISSNGDLSKWAKQGVLLLNSVLSVRKGEANSHSNYGWEIFTNEVIKVINDKKENIIFILWGAYAQKKAKFIDNKKHFVIKSPHPSPLSSYRGFFGSKPFSKTNSFLMSKNINIIDWELKV
jgi:uracil-DNA glycosylase